MSEIRAIIAGSRSVTDYRVVERAVKESGWADDIAVVVSGGARGVDRLGERWADAHLREVDPFPARWDGLSHPRAVIKVRPDGSRYNVMAGLIRNREMAENADLLIAIWDGKSKGTKNMIFEARDVGIPVYIHRVAP